MKKELSTVAFPEYPEIAEFRRRATAMETQWEKTLQRLSEKAAICDFRALKNELSRIVFPEYAEIAEFRNRATMMEMQWEDTLQRLSEKADTCDFRELKEEISKVAFPKYAELAEICNRAHEVEVIVVSLEDAKKKRDFRKMVWILDSFEFPQGYPVADSRKLSSELEAEFAATIVTL